MANVSVTNVTMLNAQNGARIKVFGGNPSPSSSIHTFFFCLPRIEVVTLSDSTVGGGTGFVQNITFKDFFGMFYAPPTMRSAALTSHVVQNVDNPVLIDQVHTHVCMILIANR